MQKMFSLLSLLFLLVFSSCNNNNLKNHTFIPQRVISQLSDSSFFSGPFGDLKFYNNLIFASNDHGGKIFVFDSLLNLKYTIGQYGAGPGEFRGTGYLFISLDTIYAYDYGGNRINVYDLKGTFEREIILNDHSRIMSEFVISNDNKFIYVATPASNYPITKYDINGNVVKKFGIWVQAPTFTEKYEKNWQNLSIDKNGNIISVLTSEPIVEKYDTDGNLRDKLDLSDLECLKERLNVINQAFKANKSRKGYIIQVLFHKVYLDKNKLYILFATEKTGKLIEYTDILEVSTPLLEKMKIKCEIHLKQSESNNEKGVSWYFPFCVSGDAIYSGNALYFSLTKFMEVGK